MPIMSSNSQARERVCSHQRTNGGFAYVSHAAFVRESCGSIGRKSLVCGTRNIGAVQCDSLLK